MQKSSKTEARRSLLLSIFVLGLVTTLMVVPYQFSSEAGSQKKAQGLIPRTTVNEEGLDYYDIRADKAGSETIAEFRQAAGSDAVAANVRGKFGEAEENLRRSVPTLKVEYNLVLGTPELIAPDPLKGAAVMTSSTRNRVETLRNFVKTNSDLVGVSDEQIDGLRVQTDFVNKVGGMGHVILEQRINDIPVFHGELLGAYTKDGELFRVTNNLAAGLDYNSLSTDFGDPANAVRIAAENVKAEVDMTQNAQSTDSKAIFGDGYYPATATKYYFPIEPGIARAAWYVIVWKPVTGYEMFIDAETGQILWRMNMGKDQTQSATYNVWNSTNSGVLSMDNPAPLTPGPIDPSLGTQGTLLPRTMMTLIGNEAPNAFNNNGWITDGGNTTVGNNTNAGLDRATPNGPEPVTASSGRTFDFAINPPPGNPGPGEEPLPPGETPTPCDAAPLPQIPYQQASAVQMFYVVNRLHDVLYRHGFTEETRNFQTDNFARGGIGGDAVLAEGQDCAGVNNANMASSTTDGTTARMQMFLWTAPTPDRDGTMDAEIILHEIGHGVTNRNHINGISGTQGGQMHEGNGDFQAHLLLSESTDPINGIYTTGGYATLNLRAGPPFNGVGNYYYGIRRFPKAVIAFTGGPLNRPHNPMTYADIDPAQMNLTNGAFAPAFPGSATAVHDGGEIWSSMLWEVRSRLVQRLGHTAGTSKMLQLWMDQMRLTTSTSSMRNSRNALLAAAQASGTAADVADIWAGFAARGLGFSATNPSGNTVVEAFDLPELGAGGPGVVTSGNNLLEPNECNTVNVPITNNSANPATNITAVLSSTTPGITVSQPNSAYPDMASGDGPVNNLTPFEVSVDNTVACFTSANFTLTVTFTGGGGGSPVTTNFSLPVGQAGLNYNLTTTTGTIPAGGTLVPLSTDDDFVVNIPLPAGWSSTVYGSPVDTIQADTNGNLTVNAPGRLNSRGNAALPSAGTLSPLPPTAKALFPYWDDLDMDVGDVVDGGIYTQTIGSAPNRQLVIEWRAEFFNESTTNITTHFAVVLTEGSDAVRYIYTLTGAGTHAGGATATVGMQAASTGPQFTQFSHNTASLTPGMQIDAARPPGVCSPGPGTCGPVTGGSARGDFDDDGRTDIAVWRPSDGNWHISQSTDGYVAYAWGASGDQIVTGTYDGDGKADVAVYRQSTGTWFILNSSDSTYSTYSWGGGADVAVPGDYDDDGHTDVAVRRPSTGEYFILKSSGGTQTSTWGNSTDTPVVGDFDGDGQTDIAVWRPSNGTWYGLLSSEGVGTIVWGTSGDMPVHADYDGDGADDVAVWRPSTGEWFILNSSDDSYTTYTWGAAGDVPVPGNYDGDARDDIGVFRNGVWHIDRTTGGYLTASWGIGTDIAVPAEYIP